MKEKDGESTVSHYEGSRKAKQYRVQFRQNRCYELYVGRALIEFAPNGVQVLDEGVVKHPDFVRVQNMFSVVEG